MRKRNLIFRLKSAVFAFTSELLPSDVRLFIRHARSPHILWDVRDTQHVLSKQGCRFCDALDFSSTSPHIHVVAATHKNAASDD